MDALRAPALDTTEFLDIAFTFFVRAIEAADLRDGEDRPQEWVEAERRLKEEFADIFAEELPGPPRADLQADTMIDLPEPDQSVRPNYRAMFAVIPQSEEKRTFLAKTFDALIRSGRLEPSTSIYNSPAFCVDKDRSNADLMKRFRAVFNFKAVNEIFPFRTAIFKRISVILNNLSKFKILGCADICSAFYQLAVLLHLRKYLAVTHPVTGQRLQFTCWPFGFSWSP